MRKSSLLLCACSLSFFQIFAQRELENPLVNSKVIMEKGVALHNDGKYKAAITEYLKVPVSDTNYSLVLHELILSYYTDSNFNAAEKYSNEALLLFPNERAKWYGFLANVYDETNRTGLALQTYDTILTANPFNYLVWFNKGITLYRKERYDEAGLNFQKCVMINPYYSSAHYYLGELALLNGNLVESMLSFSTYLLIAPSGRFNKKAITFLQTIAEVNISAEEYLKKYKPGRVDDFEEIQEILTSKASLNKQYKLKAELEDPIVRQLQVMIEKLEYTAGDPGFWMQYYVPLYKGIWDRDQYEPLIFTMFSDLDIKKVKEYNAKEKKKLESFSTAATNYLNELRESQELVYNKRTNAKPQYYIKNYWINGRGNYTLTNKNEKEVSGPWEFFYENGSKKSAGTFTNGGQRTGVWSYFYNNGIQSELSQYAEDKANGKSQVWSDNGLLYTNSNYVNDLKEGQETTYYYSGRLSSVINYKAGKKNGPAKYYHVNDYLKTVTSYKDDLQDGTATYYHANGKVESVLNYTNDVSGGEYKEYHENANLKMKGMLVAGEKSGLWLTYYDDNKISYQENFVKGELDGEWISYYKNGKVASKNFYKKGEAEGKQENFDEDGLVYSETIFEKGRLRDIKFFNKKGEVISNTTSRKGNAEIAFYGADGSKESQGYYSKDGLGEGEFTYYFKNGDISARAVYKDGKTEGKKTLFFPNNKVKQEGNYKADKADGYFVNHYLNGQVSFEGWYVDDQQQGTALDYDLLGKMTSKQYYLNGDIHGVAEYFSPDGKLDNKQYYDKGWFYKIEQYDSAGNLVLGSSLNKGEGKVHFNHPNGKLYFESNYKHYKLNGSYKVMNGDGTKRSLTYYKNGALDSNYTYWHPNGQVQTEGIYDKGSKTGLWKYYYRNGKLLETETYNEGLLDGKSISYDEQGNVTREYNFSEGNLDGGVKHFGDNGMLIMVTYYKKDEIQGYSYEDKTGQLLPMIPLKKGSGTLNAYYRTGEKSAHMTFNEGALNGERTFYYSNGKVRSVGNFINGLDNGNYKSYYASGKIMKDHNYYFGEEHGAFKNYNEDGSLTEDVNYYLGDLNGECKYFTAGKLTSTYLYKYGVMESKK